MSKPSSILTEWAESGLDQALLPQSGLWVQLRMPSLERLARRGQMPEALVSTILGVEGDEAKVMQAVAAKPKEEQEAIVQEGFKFSDSMVAAMIVGLKRTESDSWEKVDLAPSKVADIIPERDLECLRKIANREITPAMATIVSKRMRGEMSEEEAIAAVEEEAKHSAERVVGGWGSFRYLGEGKVGGADSEGVGGPTVLADRRPRSGRRVRTG